MKIDGKRDRGDSGHGPSPDFLLKEHFFEPANPVHGVVSWLVTMELIMRGTRRGSPAWVEGRA